MRDWFSQHAWNIEQLGWRAWLRCELRDVALLLRLTRNQQVLKP
jgi:hypothetical protein